MGSRRRKCSSSLTVTDTPHTPQLANATRSTATNRIKLQAMAKAFELLEKRRTAYRKYTLLARQEKGKKKGAAAAASVVKRERLSTAEKMLQASMAGGFHNAKASHLDSFKRAGSSGTGRHDGALLSLIEAEVCWVGFSCRCLS